MYDNNFVTCLLGMSQQEQKESESTLTSGFTPVIYYGSREPKQSVTETDRIIFQMMDDIKSIPIKSSDTLCEEEKQKQEEKPHHGIIWRFRIILSSIIILLLVIGKISHELYSINHIHFSLFSNNCR